MTDTCISESLCCTLKLTQHCQPIILEYKIKSTKQKYKQKAKRETKKKGTASLCNPKED